MFSFTYTKPKYDKLTSDADSERNDVLLDATPQAFPRFWRFGVTFTLVFSNFISALLIIAILTSHEDHVENGFEMGYHSDFGPAREHIELQQVIFTGSSSFTYAGVEFQHHPPQVRYVGEPSPEIDKAWRDLTSGGMFLATEEEINSQWPGEYSELWNKEKGGYMISLDVYRTLDCLNLLRRGLSPEHYGHTDGEDTKSKANHCIERIRQSIMCAGDLTPSPSRYNPGLGRHYIDEDYSHTCRNFDRLDRWAKERAMGQLAVKPVRNE
ncbi:hypothetical protein N7494_001490 [Penicillium frequentans]|uniref:Cyclochlorotine biosynthesis protein O n=1 Tax=Penicillium frequentans TaxID=3151616 RepID=A0AAD6D1U0_9EURO|nr:hypothetical protein N7494_001490 [Penicillium glabrum]